MRKILILREGRLRTYRSFPDGSWEVEGRRFFASWNYGGQVVLKEA